MGKKSTHSYLALLAHNRAVHFMTVEVTQALKNETLGDLSFYEVDIKLCARQ